RDRTHENYRNDTGTDPANHYVPGCSSRQPGMLTGNSGGNHNGLCDSSLHEWIANERDPLYLATADHYRVQPSGIDCLDSGFTASGPACDQYGPLGSFTT